MSWLQSCLMISVIVTQIGKIYGLSLPKSSLAFVVDDTSSMQKEIEQVKDSVTSIFDTVTMSTKSQIENFVLVTFNDPDAKLLTVTKDRNDFMNALKGIYVHGGETCPEYSMKGIKIALENSLPFSYIYVFTDASAEDYNHYKEVISIAQKKQIQVTFLITGECSSRSDADYQVYHKVAKATSGLVFNMSKRDVQDILNYIVESIKGRSNVLFEMTFPPGLHEVKLAVDNRMDDLIISATGRKLAIEVSDPEGKILTTKDIVKKTEIKIVAVPKEKPGIYVAKINSTSDKSVKVTGKTSIDFQHGFSTFEPTSLSETATRPATDGSTYLSVQLLGEGVRFQTAIILDLNNNILEELPLQVNDKDANFYTTKQFYPPSTAFKISVIGYDEETETLLKRLAATPIERQNLKYETVDDTKPTVKIINGPIINVNYNAPVQVKCAVHGYPKPNIIWHNKDTGVVMESKVLTVEAPYKFLSILDIERSTKNSTFECNAINKLGKDKDHIEIKTEKYFKIVESPYVIKEVKYDKETIIPCRVDALPPATVNWYKNGAKVVNDTNILIASDMGTLTIKHMDIKSAGIFMCEASNEFYNNVFYSKVTVSGLAEPKINKTDEKRQVLRGEDDEIECRIIRGTPRPIIQWFFQSPHNETFEAINDTGEILRLKDVTSNQAGTYLCSTTNELGTDRYAVELVVNYPPTIKDSEITIVAEDGKTVVIPCDVDGVPSPTVEWFKNDILLDNSSDAFQITAKHSLKFRAQVKSNNGHYTCKAKNSLGSSYKTVLVNIFDPPHVDIPKNFTFNTTIGGDVFLPCRADGYPQPTIEWIHNNIRGKRAQDTWYPEGILRLRNMQLKDDGYYTCVASNDFGAVNVTYQVNVQAPPVIERQYSDTTFRAVTNDLLLKISCKAIGGPEPTITWKRGDLDIPRASKWYDIDYGTLIIKNINEEAEGTYTCVAHNSIGNDSVDYNVTVTDYPLIDEPVSTIWVEEGKSVDVPCNLSHQIYDVIRWYKDRMFIANNTLTLNNTKLKDAGIYSCRISDLVKARSAHIHVLVGYKPSFISEEEEEIEFKEGGNASLVCEASGEPKPEVSWWLNDKNLTTTDTTYNLKMKPSNTGRYTCKALNSFGSIHRSFNIVTTGCILDTRNDFLHENQPLMISSPSSFIFTWSSFHVSEGYMLMNKDDKFYLHCSKGFFKFPSKQTVMGYCRNETNISIDGDIFKYRDIECIEENEIIIRESGTSCHLGNTEYQVGYQVYENFLQVYDVCLDKDNNVPLYVGHEITVAQYGVARRVNKWFPNDLTPLDYDSIYHCKNQAEDISHYLLGRPFDNNCCFEKRQLVNPKDLKPGIPRTAASSYLNVSPHWSTCNSKNWAALEDKVSKFASLFEKGLTIHTGTASRSKMDLVIHDRYGRKQSVAQYLWKVVQDPVSNSSLAIIQVNVPDVKNGTAYVHCEDICYKIDWMQGTNWTKVEDGYTYCCSILDFEAAFSYYGAFNSFKTNILYR